jgi:hypothetical protein
MKENKDRLVPLRGEMARIGEIVGYTNALALLGAFHLQRKIVFSSRMRGKAWAILCQILGEELATKLCTEYGGEVVDITGQAHIAKAYRNDTIQHLHALGLPTKAIAKELGVSEGLVCRTVAAHSRRNLHANQLPLPLLGLPTIKT